MKFHSRVVLITGGTGSFGNAVLSRFLRQDVGEIRIFSRDEKKQDDMRKQYSDPRIRYFIGDVRDFDGVRAAMTGVQHVFHAAALKQVPSCEFFPLEAYKTNVLGTDNVVTAAVDADVEKVVLLSTDKAVHPVNAMGLSKAMAEKVLVARARQLSGSPTTLCATRYGNVLCSRGSVVPLFLAQLAQGQPLTVTDPKMTRFLMTLEESVDLVLHALLHGRQGDIFVQKSPAATIGDLATAVASLLQAPSTIRTIGTRHGEKLFETLVSREEMVRASDEGRFYRVPADGRDLDYDKYFFDGEIEISSADDYSSHNTERLSLPQLERLLQTQPEVVEAMERRRGQGGIPA